MNPIDPKYNFALVREMLRDARHSRRLRFHAHDPAAREIRRTGRLLLTGEGSSRIFPAKNTMSAALRMGAPLALFTEGARQAHEYCLSGMGVFGASNSGRTKELISLFGVS